ncbi:MAG: YeeE/YedE family protein [Deferribacteres bacterium]|nr:YeeE/YedE family protein [Deferribacteres bacterium]
MNIFQQNSLYEFLFINPWPWWFGGVLIGLFVPFFYLTANLPLGVSTGYGNLCRAVLPDTKLEALNTPAYRKIFTWRVFFIAGIILGAALARILSGDYALVTEMGRFGATVTHSFSLTAVWFFSGGILLGFGARTAGGCPSAHTIHGIPCLAPSGFVATAGFFAGGLFAVNLIYRILF